jgi:hypothetical protein
MKLRIKSDSLRYRLTKTDVADLLKEGFLKEKISFGDDALTYVLQKTSDAELSTDFKNNIITIYIPADMIEELANTDRVGFEKASGQPHILIEKDFTCIENVKEDQSDNYPNPLAH